MVVNTSKPATRSANHYLDVPIRLPCLGLLVLHGKRWHVGKKKAKNMKPLRVKSCPFAGSHFFALRLRVELRVKIG